MFKLAEFECSKPNFSISLIIQCDFTKNAFYLDINTRTVFFMFVVISAIHTCGIESNSFFLFGSLLLDVANHQ